MRHRVDPDLVAIAREIVALARSEAEWAEVASCDMFQRGAYCGGFEATEMAFTFSFWRDSGDEVWLQASLAEVAAIASGELLDVEARPAE